MRSPWRLLRRGAIVGLVLFVLPACTETDELLVENVGVTQLVLVDPGLLPQSVFSPFDRIQSAEWVVTSATLNLDGALVDLLLGEPCTFADTVFAAPTGEGPCASGVVIESSTDDFEVELFLTVASMSMRRAEPVDLPPDGNFDGDGVLNAVDNCPLIDNDDQDDDDDDGVGVLCTVPQGFYFGLTDSDRDGIPDILDNCVWKSNADQSDTTGLGARSILDGIGDVCGEQIARVQDSAGNLTFQLSFPSETLSQTDVVPTYLTVDFNSQRALRCTWESGICVLDPAQVEFCTRTSFSAAQGGC